MNEVLSFLPFEKQKCIEIAIVDDDVALEGTEELMLTLEFVGSQQYLFGDITTALIQVVDDDGKSFVIIANIHIP